MIPFNIPVVTGDEQAYLSEALTAKRFCGDQHFTRRCEAWLETFLSVPKALLTASCTQALEIAAMLLNIEPGDEVIMPSYTFVSTANAFVLRGAKVCFVDVDANTLNIDLDQVEAAITQRTKAIVPVHYAGMSCDMERLMTIANARGVYVVEDAAQALSSSWNGRKLGTFGHLSCFSFHETKNYQCGEGGALIINDEALVSRAEIIREKGTNRRQFFEGLVDKYTWVDLGTSGLPSELQAAFLLAQFENISLITQRRLHIWSLYEEQLSGIAPMLKPAPQTQHNAHIFALMVRNRSDKIAKLRDCGVAASFHYIPLHSSQGGSEWGQFVGEDHNTTQCSSEILRLPLYFDLGEEQVQEVIQAVVSCHERSL